MNEHRHEHLVAKLRLAASPRKLRFLKRSRASGGKRSQAELENEGKRVTEIGNVQSIIGKEN